jgi:2-dehydro-3-deoxyphosphogluconate aldolase/(4S)-4-hydroxy-2-oxoglutarate aldolase
VSERSGKEAVARAIEEQRLVAVLRGDDGGRLVEVAAAVIEGGFQVIKVAMTAPGALKVIKKLVAGKADNVLFGAGSVTTLGEAVEAIDCGASFVVCPHTDIRIIEYCFDNGIFIAAGGLTPTEVMEASLAGVDLVKVYPVTAVGGADYITFLLRPMPFLRLMAVGGLAPADVRAYIKAGAVAVGVSALPLEPGEAESASPEAIRDRAKAFITAVKESTG